MRRSRFTLIEMLVVICILLILMALGAAGVNKVLQNNAKKQTKLAVKGVVAACESYKNRYGSMPGAATTWTAVDFGSKLHDGGAAAGGGAQNKWYIDYTALELTLSSNQIQDYWGNNLRYRYTAAGDFLEVYSFGPDGNDDAGLNNGSSTVDDISSSGP
ncbi:MAG: hypothetical protein RL095_2189 [Verrucomicrobiota bacterium]|jgi:prepilin-type N-terminal cleavage/methylation domain-containing protein